MRFFLWGLALIGAMGVAPPAAAQLASEPASEWTGSAAEARSETSSRALQNQTRPAEADLHHVVGRDGTTLYNRPDSTLPVAVLPSRTPLHRLDCEDNWCRVRTDDEDTGYVPASAISNVWLRVSKARRQLYVYRGPRLVDVFNIDIGYNTFADKRKKGSRTQRDHWRTPEGTFYVIRKNPQSSFHKALVLNYPTVQDARRGLQEDLISRSQYRTIVEAQEAFRMPPMNTKLGGWIEIHGQGTGASINWTQGCVAVHNHVINELWTEVDVGTPVLIE